MRKEPAGGSGARSARGHADFRVFLRLFVTLTVLLGSFPPPATAWVYLLNSPGRPPFYASDRTLLNKVSIDNRGDVYACGVISLDGDPPGRITIVKLAGQTGQLLWQSGMAGSVNYRAYNECRSLLIDSQGSVLVGANVTVGGYSIIQLVVTKLTGEGRTVWSRWLGDVNDGIRSSLADAAIDSNGDVLALGRVNSFGYGNTLLKLSGIGGIESWHSPPFQGLDYAAPLSMAVDGAGDVVLAGIQYISEGAGKVILQKLSGRDGRELWRHEQLRPILVRSASVAIDASEDVFLGDTASVAKLSGSTGNPMWVSAVPAGKVVLDPYGVPAILMSDGSGVVKLDPLSGREIWRRNEDNDHSIGDLASDGSANVAMAGSSRGPTGGMFSISKLSGGSGGLLWRKDFPGEFVSSGADAVTVDLSGDVTAAGTAVQRSRDAWGEEYADSLGVVVKVWGRTGSDYPPSSGQILVVLSDAILALHLPLNVERSLIDRIETAKSYLDDADSSNDILAIRSLKILMNRLASMRGRTLAVADADALTALALRAIGAIS
jgi:putative pyrroloquinoline-quinone binding quinoprotein